METNTVKKCYKVFQSSGFGLRLSLYSLHMHFLVFFFLVICFFVDFFFRIAEYDTNTLYISREYLLFAILITAQ